MTKRGNIVINFIIGLLLTLMMLYTGVSIFANIFQYNSESKGHQAFANVVNLMKDVNNDPPGTRQSVLVRLPDDWAILGFDGTPLESVRVLRNGLVVHKRGYMPEECRGFDRCVCLVKNLDVAETIYWEKTLRCVDLGDEGENIPLVHYTNVGTSEYTYMTMTASYPFVWKGGFGIIESRDGWTDVWDQRIGVELFIEQAADVAAPVFVEKTSEGRIAVCTHPTTCIPEGVADMDQKRERALEQYIELERRWRQVSERWEQIGESEEVAQQIHENYAALMRDYHTFIRSGDYLHLTQYQQDSIFTHRRISAQRGQQWAESIQYTHVARYVVQNSAMRQGAQAAKDMFDCKTRDTITECQNLELVCEWNEGKCERLQRIQMPDPDCGDRQNEGACRFGTPRLCGWGVQTATRTIARCVDAS